MIDPPADIALDELLGAWHVVATTLPFWRGKKAPVITYGVLPGEGVRWSDAVTFEARGLFGGAFTPRRILGVDTGDAERPGSFTWRGAGVLGLLTSRWSFVAVDPDGEWAVTWFARATFGVTPEGLDVYARRADLDPGVIEGVIASLAARADLAHLGPWLHPEQ